MEVSAGNAAGNNTLELPASGSKLITSNDSNNVDNLGIVTATRFVGDGSDLSGVSAGHTSKEHQVLQPHLMWEFKLQHLIVQI